MTREGKRRCGFCGRSGKLTGEHLWADWLRELLSNKEAPFPHRRTSTIGGLDHQWLMPPFTLRVNEVCRACNNGWMSELEEQAKPLLKPMILGKPTQLSERDQVTLATWAAKTAMVYQLTTKHRAIRPYEYEYLRLHLKPRSPAQVWLATRTNEEPKPSIFGYRASGMAPTRGGPPRHEGYLITLAIGYFVAQVYGHDLEMDSEALWTRRGPLAPSLQQIWPYAEPAGWPPAQRVRRFTDLGEDPEFEAELTKRMAARGIALVMAPAASAA
jgi:hypothetical protein